MKDYNDTRRANFCIKELGDMLTSPEFEGYSVVSDDLQRPHTYVEIYVTSLDSDTLNNIRDVFATRYHDVHVIARASTTPRVHAYIIVDVRWDGVKNE